MAGKELQSSGEQQTTPNRLGQEQRGSQTLPYVWKVLERKVTLYTPKVMYHPRLAPSKWGEMVAHVGKQQELLWEKGSDYDRAVLALFTAVTVLPHGTEHSLTRKQFKQLRSDFEELSIEEIAEGKRQLLQEMEDFQDETERFRFNSES